MATISRRELLKLGAAGAVLASSGVALAQAEPRRNGAHGKTPAGRFDLALEGGGIKGVAFAGALDVLLERGFKVRRLIGTSAGAIAATCLVAGYQSKDLLQFLTEHTEDGRHRFSTFLAPPKSPPFLWQPVQAALIGACAGLHFILKRISPNLSRERMEDYVRKFVSLLATGAIADDAAFVEWMGERLKNAPIQSNAEMTLQEFHRRTHKNGMQLSLIATDVTARRLLVLNHHTAPDVPVVQAVRMSMGFPLVWKEVEWQAQWGTYRKQPMLENGEPHRIVDGGVLSNFPLKFFLDKRHSAPEGVLGPPPRAADAADGDVDRNAADGDADAEIPSLGLLLDETKEPPEGVATPKKRFRDNLIAYQSTSRLIDTITSAWDQDAIREFDAAGCICPIGVKGVDTLDFEMDEQQLAGLAESGRLAMSEYLKNFGGK